MTQDEALGEVMEELAAANRRVKQLESAIAGPNLTISEVYAALAEIGRRIELCGASPALTHAVSLTSDLRRAIGNEWNAPDAYAADLVRKTLARQ